MRITKERRGGPGGPAGGACGAFARARTRAHVTMKMDRRMAVSLLAFLSLSVVHELAAAKADKPNIVLLFADDVRALARCCSHLSNMLCVHCSL